MKMWQKELKSLIKTTMSFSANAYAPYSNFRVSAGLRLENGKILKRFAEEGELIGSGNPVFLYGASKDGWVLRAGVTDQQIIQLQVGDQASITFDAYPDLKFSAKVSEIEAVANPYTGTFEVELQLSPTDAHLYSGFVGKVTITPGIRQKYSIVPIEALIEGDETEGYVYGADRGNTAVSGIRESLPLLPAGCRSPGDRRGSLARPDLER